MNIARQKNHIGTENNKIVWIKVLDMDISILSFTIFQYLGYHNNLHDKMQTIQNKFPNLHIIL